MFGRMIRYEMKRSLPLYIVWAAIAVLLALPARLGIFSLTDMPLFYLMLFSSIGIMLYRYKCTIHGKEAAFLFTTDLSPRKHILVRYCSALILSIITALMIGLVLIIQGEKLGAMLRNLSFPMVAMLTAEIAISAFSLFIEISAALTLSNIRPFSKRPIACFVIFEAIMIILYSLLPRITQTLIPTHFIVTSEGELLISAMNTMPANTPFALNFSLNIFAWNIIFSCIFVICIPLLIQKKLLITG